MAFKGITFAGQNVTPKNDGGLYQAHYGDGILWGCSMAISGDDLVIQSGEFIMGGRVVQVDGATNVDLSGRVNSTGYIQVIMNADLSQGEGLQWYTSFVESATTTFPVLTKDDINDTGTLYQLQLAVVQISGGNLTSIASSLGRAGVVTISPNSLVKGRIITSDNGSSFMLVDNDDAQVSYSGLYLGNDERPILFGKDGVHLRPNGVSDSTGQVFINTDGQQIGGHPIHTSDNTNYNFNYTANSFKNLASLNIRGDLIVFGEISFTPSSSTATEMTLGIGSTATTNIFTNWRLTNQASGKRLQVNAIMSANTDIFLNFNCGVAGTIYAYRFRAVRIN